MALYSSFACTKEDIGPIKFYAFIKFHLALKAPEYKRRRFAEFESVVGVGIVVVAVAVVEILVVIANAVVDAVVGCVVGIAVVVMLLL